MLGITYEPLQDVIQTHFMDCFEIFIFKMQDKFLSRTQKNDTKNKKFLYIYNNISTLTHLQLTIFNTNMLPASHFF